MSEKKKLYTATFRFEGRRYYVRSSVSQREADKKAILKQKELEDNTQILSPSTTVQDYVTLWMETYIENSMQSTSYQSIQAYVNNLILPSIGKMRLRDVRPMHLQKLFAQKVGYSKTYYNKLKSLLKRIFAQAMRDHLVRDNPAEGLIIPKSSDGTRRSITDEERAALLYASDWHSFGLFLQIMLWCGLRPQEVAALRWEDIDQINHTIYVQRAWKRDGSLGETKSASGNRVVPIPPQLWVRLAHRIPESGYLLRPANAPYYNRYEIRHAWQAFRRDLDVALGAECISHRGKLLIKKSVIADDLQMYCLRHTYCTDLQSAGVPINIAKELMGHSDISITAQIYTHMSDDAFLSAARKIADYGATTGATHLPDKPRISKVNQTKSDSVKSHKSALKAN